MHLRRRGACPIISNGSRNLLALAVRHGSVAMMSPAVVLIVEDDYLVRLHAVFILEEAGFGVLEAASADEAIALLEVREDIRIVFTDINMPGSMDGLRLAHAIRNRWPPIELVVTSGQMQVRKEEMPERGLFLAKPYEPSKLVHMVRVAGGLERCGTQSVRPSSIAA